jgi:2-dehydropantoate 2-reductase
MMEAKGPSTGEHSTAPREQDETDPVDGSKDTLDEQAFDYTLSAMDRQYATQTSVPRRIHILGTGSIGKLVAHSLRGIANPPPITLLLHRKNLLQAWERSTKEITIQDDGIEVKRKGFEAELMPLRRRQHGVEVREGEADLYEHEDAKPHEIARAYREQGASLPTGSDALPYEAFTAERIDAEPIDVESQEDDTIHNLIVTTKASFTVNALSNIMHRLTPDSTICFLQNGMGIIDEINEKLYPNEYDRPNYMQGIITHGVNVPPEIPEAKRAWYAVHAGHGTLSLSLVKSSQAKISTLPADPIRAPQDIHDAQTDLWASSSRYLIRTLTRTPVLCAVGFTPTELLQLQLEKLAVNSVLNPLTVLLDNRNGSILYNFAPCACSSPKPPSSSAPCPNCKISPTSPRVSARSAWKPSSSA